MDGYLIFEDGHKPYKFDLNNMVAAIQFSHDNNWPLLAIKTPYYYLSVVSDEDFTNIMEGTEVKIPTGQNTNNAIQSGGSEATQCEQPT